MPRTKEQKRLFLELIAKAQELYDSVKSSIKDSRTKINYSYLVNNSNNMNSVEKVIREYHNTLNIYPISEYLDLSSSRAGQDVRYALDDSKLRVLGWEPKIKFDNELPSIVEYYKNKFIW
jgi:dTDP-D-glucose 4,6-dehydratase